MNKLVHLFLVFTAFFITTKESFSQTHDCWRLINTTSISHFLDSLDLNDCQTSQRRSCMPSNSPSQDYLFGFDTNRYTFLNDTLLLSWHIKDIETNNHSFHIRFMTLMEEDIALFHTSQQSFTIDFNSFSNLISEPKKEPLIVEIIREDCTTSQKAVVTF